MSSAPEAGPPLPDLPGLAEARPWTNREATDSSEVPRRLAVVGAGGVGVEMATAWQGLGSKVTLLARGSQLLPRMEPFVGELVGRGLADAGVDVRMGVSVRELRRPYPYCPVVLTLADDTELEVDEILFATGREPLTDHIGLETVGLAPRQLARRRRHLPGAGPSRTVGSTRRATSITAPC